jgi:hypothetical protein
MKLRTLLLLLASLIWFGVAVGTPLLAQASATVVIVIDDTQIRPGDGPSVAELIDRLERDVLDSRTTFGIVTVGPAGLNVDLTRERRRLREASEAARAGHLDFTLTPNPDMAADALVATLAGVIGGLAKRPGPKTVVVVGRTTTLAEKRHATWVAVQRDADSATVAGAWFELGADGCQTSDRATSASLTAKTGPCASLADAAAVRRALGDLAALLRR